MNKAPGDRWRVVKPVSIRGAASRLRDRGAEIANDVRALLAMFATLSVWGAAVVLAAAWLALALRVFRVVSGLE